MKNYNLLTSVNLQLNSGNYQVASKGEDVYGEAGLFIIVNGFLGGANEHSSVLVTHLFALCGKCSLPELNSCKQY